MLLSKQRLLPYRKIKTAALFVFFLLLHALLFVTIRPRSAPLKAGDTYSNSITLHIKGDVLVAKKTVERKKIEEIRKPIESPVKEQTAEEIPPAEQLLEDENTLTKREDAGNSFAENSDETYDSGIEDIRSKVIALIEQHKIYPLAARKRALEGDVVVSFVVQTDGSVRDIVVEDGNTNSLLKQAAAKSVAAAFPCGLTPASPLAMKVTLRYSLSS